MYLENRINKYRFEIQEINCVFFSFPQNRLAANMDRNILDINDDCMFEIFTNLTVTELANAASVCSRFKTIARDVFSSRHKSICFEVNISSTERRRQATDILRNFGDLLTKLKVRFIRHKDANIFVINLLLMYCTENLDTLELRYCRALQPEKIINATALFRNVKELILIDSKAIDDFFLSDAKKLIRLTLEEYNPKAVVKFLSNDYPQLQALAVRNQEVGRNKIDIVGFLKRHPNVIELELRGGGVYDLSSIGECQFLRKLSILDCENCKITPIVHLENLTTLKILTGYGCQSAIGLLMASKSSQSLEELSLSGYLEDDVEELIPLVRRFTNLKQFSFTTNDDVGDDMLNELRCLKELRVLSVGGDLLISSDCLVDLVQELPQLEQLTLHPDQHLDCIQLQKATFLRICEIYRTRNKKLMISNFDGSDEELRKKKRKELLFAGNDQREFVRFITLKMYYNNYETVEI